MTLIKRIAPLALLLSMGGIGCNNSPKAPNIPEDVLPLSQSGTNKYPALHSVFANNRQDAPSYSIPPPPKLDFDSYFNNLPNGDYRRTDYGNEYINLLSQQMVTNGANSSIERALVEVTNELNGRFNSRHRPVYRLSKTSTINNQQKDFEVLVIVGTEKTSLENRRSTFNAVMLRHAMTKTYGNIFKVFKILDNPSWEKLESAIIARAESAKKNNRKLYIAYIGHGNHNGYQEGVAESDFEKHGSQRFIFGLNRIRFTEDDYKVLLNKHLSDVETVSIITSCYSGAAVTAIDPDIERRLQIGLG